MNKILQGLTNQLSLIPRWVYIFFLSAVNFVSFDPSPNEENNFTMARHFMDPTWMEGSFSLQQWPGTNYIYWFIAGIGLKFLSFGQLAFATRFINYLLYAFPQAKLFEKFKISIPAMLFILQLFMLKQAYFGGEWIWQGFEGKTIGYIFIFWSLNYLLDERYQKAAVFAALATYCHVLVGGWYFVSLILFTLIKQGFQWNLFKTGITYTVIVLPFIIYLAVNLFGGESIANEPSVDWIYVFFRNIHHTAPTHMSRFWEHNIGYFIIIFIATLVSIFGLKHTKITRSLSLLTLCMNGMMIMAMIISLIDTDGVLLKFYLFRIGSLAMLLTYCFVFIAADSFLQTRNRVSMIFRPIMFIFGVYLVSIGIWRNIIFWNETTQEKDYQAFVEFVQDNTSPSDVFLFLGYNDKNENVSFISDAERDRLVSFKMVPEGDNAIVEWYNRIKLRDDFASNPRADHQLLKKYEIDYIVYKSYLQVDYVFSNNHYHVQSLKK